MRVELSVFSSASQQNTRSVRSGEPPGYSRKQLNLTGQRYGRGKPPGRRSLGRFCANLPGRGGKPPEADSRSTVGGMKMDAVKAAAR